VFSCVRTQEVPRATFELRTSQRQPVVPVNYHDDAEEEKTPISTIAGDYLASFEMFLCFYFFSQAENKKICKA
jgi:hypothetical protein